MGVSLLLLAVLGIYAWRSMLEAYFTSESRVLKLLHSVPRRSANALLVEAEQNVETFCEVTGVVDDQLDMRLNTATAEPGAQGTLRKRSMLMLMWLAALVLIGLVVGQFVVPMRFAFCTYPLS